MSSVKKIICLSNSLKLTERCIAGIDIDSGKWVRPICDHLYPNDGRVPKTNRLVAGREPEILDILEIPLSDTGNDFGFECENRTILPGEWKFLGKAKPSDLIKYCQGFSNILHNSLKYVNPTYLQSLPFNERRTLQLIQTTNFSITNSSTGWRGTVITSDGYALNGAKITDPIFVEKLNLDPQTKTSSYLVTISLGMPWAPHDWEGERPCWKLIAGVIEI